MNHAEFRFGCISRKRYVSITKPKSRKKEKSIKENNKVFNKRIRNEEGEKIKRNWITSEKERYCVSTLLGNLQCK